MLVGVVAVHLRKSSPKEPDAKFSVYFQPAKLKFGYSRRMENDTIRGWLFQKAPSGWKSIRVRGAGLKNDESIES